MNELTNTEIDPRIEHKFSIMQSQLNTVEAKVDQFGAAVIEMGQKVSRLRDAQRASQRRALVRNVVVIGAMASIGVGCWWIYPASALIVVGLIPLGVIIYGVTLQGRLEISRAGSRD